MVSKLSHIKLRDSSEISDLILDCADDALRQHGYRRMTMEDLATRAGLGKGTIYLYFDSKEDVALSVIDRSNMRLRERLRQICRRPESATSRLRALLVERVMNRFDCAQSHADGLDDLFSMLRPQLFERREKYKIAESQILAEVLIEGRTLGEFQLDDPFAVAEAFITATASLLPYSLSPQQLGARQELLERTTFLTDILINAVRTVSSRMDQTAPRLNLHDLNDSRVTRAR